MITPTTQEVAETIVSQLEGSLEETFLPKSFARVLAKSFAGVFLLVYKYAGFMLLQQFVPYATDKPTIVNGKVVRPLVEWGRLIGAGEPIAASRAELKIAVTVQSRTGDLPAGAQLVRAPTGVIYQVIAAVPLNAATVTATIRASSDQSGGGGEGIIGNLAPGDTVDFASPLRVATKATVTSVVVTGANAESTAAYRARVLRRFQRRPQGGAYADYEAWAEEVAGVVSAYPYSGAPGEVEVYIEVTAESSQRGDGLPTPAQIQAVKDNIESKRPANVAVRVHPVGFEFVDVVIVGLEPDTSEIRAAIEAGVSEYLRLREPFIVGLSALPRTDRITQAALSGIADSIVAARGGSIANLILSRGASFTLERGQKARLGQPSYR